MALINVEGTGMLGVPGTADKLFASLKDKNISEKALHLSLQKIYSHKQGNNHSLDRSEVAGSGKKLFKQK